MSLNYTVRNGQNGKSYIFHHLKKKLVRCQNPLDYVCILIVELRGDCVSSCFQNIIVLERKFREKLEYK